MKKNVINCITGKAELVDMTAQEVAAREAEIAEAIVNEPVETPVVGTAELLEHIKLLEARIAVLEKEKKGVEDEIQSYQ